MTFDDALTRAAQEAQRLDPEDWIAIGGRAAVEPESWLREEGDVLLWDTTCAPGGGELCVGVGAARVVQAQGLSRCDTAVERVRAGLERIPTFGDVRLRVFGGLSFTPGDVGAFAELGQLRFVLPRWLVSRDAYGGHLQCVVQAKELDAVDTLRVEARARAMSVRPEPGTRLSVVDDGAEAFRSLTSRAIHAIEVSSLSKVVVVRHLQLAGRPALLKTLRALAGDPLTFRYALTAGHSALLGASPELLVRTDGQRVESHAVAGTLPVQNGSEIEQRLLLDSDKDRREHDYVTAAIVAALSSVGASVEHEAEPRVHTLKRVHHLVTPIVARAPGVHVLDLVRALHPTPAVSGYPRHRAQQWLAANEGLTRGWFASPVGWFDARGRGEFAVALRSALLGPDGAHLFAGCGIVRGSTVVRELAETDAKLQTALRALGVEVESPPAPALMHGGQRA